MNDIYDIFDSPQKSNNDDFDVDAWAEKKKAEREQVSEKLDNATFELSTDGEKFKEYLDIQAKFIGYTPTNAILIKEYNPNATRIGDRDYWVEGKGVYIKKPELKNYIPIFESNGEYEKEDGTMGTSYNIKHVYDISQTTTRVRRSASVSKPDEKTILRALITNTPVPIQPVETIPNDVGAVYDKKQKVIFVRRGMNATDLFRSVAKELAHADLDLHSNNYDYQKANFSAYCASYVLCKRYGFDVSDYNFDSIKSVFYEDIEAQDIRSKLFDIRDSAREINDRMSNFISKSKDKEPIEAGER